jgi:hypothetical protein
MAFTTMRTAFVAASGVAVAACLMLATCVGCGGDERVELHPVAGQVLVRGQPAANALVAFHDTRPAGELAALPIPRATTGSDGTFRLSSYADTEAPPDGAPAGSYRVTIVVPTATPAAGADPESAGSVVDKLAGRYANATTSTLTSEVKPGDNQLEPFHLQ